MSTPAPESSGSDSQIDQKNEEGKDVREEFK